jgi:hypothetical protein
MIFNHHFFLNVFNFVFLFLFFFLFFLFFLFLCSLLENSSPFNKERQLWIFFEIVVYSSFIFFIFIFFNMILYIVFHFLVFKSFPGYFVLIPYAFLHRNFTNFPWEFFIFLDGVLFECFIVDFCVFFNIPCFTYAIIDFIYALEKVFLFYLSLFIFKKITKSSLIYQIFFSIFNACKDRIKFYISKLPFLSVIYAFFQWLFTYFFEDIWVFIEKVLPFFILKNFVWLFFFPVGGVWWYLILLVLIVEIVILIYKILKG